MNETLLNIMSNDELFGIIVYILMGLIFVTLMVKVIAWIDKMIVVILHRKKDDSKRDPTRVYTTQERRVQSVKCKNRCEGVGLFFRCRNKGDLQGDHWYPHARGGATTPKNMVMLCSGCNKRKSAKVPSLFQTNALWFRRMIGLGYDSSIETVRPGEWLTRKQMRNFSANNHNDFERGFVNGKPTF